MVSDKHEQLVSAAAEASETFGDDELERCAREHTTVEELAKPEPDPNHCPECGADEVDDDGCLLHSRGCPYYAW